MVAIDAFNRGVLPIKVTAQRNRNIRVGNGLAKLMLGSTANEVSPNAIDPNQKLLKLRFVHLSAIARQRFSLNF